jgi:hypothetical protein
MDNGNLMHFFYCLLNYTLKIEAISSSSCETLFMTVSRIPVTITHTMFMNHLIFNQLDVSYQPIKCLEDIIFVL